MTGSLLSDTMRDWADEAAVPHDLADRALRGRGRRGRSHGPRRYGIAVPLVAGLATAAVVVAGLAVGGTWGPRHGTGVTPAAGLDLRADLAHQPPQSLVAAGSVAVGAVYTARVTPVPGTSWSTLQRHWSVVDPGSGTYRPTDWAWVSVAPGLERAAVLEGPLPASRIGIVDTRTGEVTRWIPTDHPVASVAWSPTSGQLVATAYDSDPDQQMAQGNGSFRMHQVDRSGFVLVDATAGTAAFHAVPASTDWPSSRNDFSWTLDGTRVWEQKAGDARMAFFDLTGAPAQRDDVSAYDGNIGTTSASMSRVSPDGRFRFSIDSGIPTQITDTKTGATYRQQALQLLAWADDEHVVALAGCEQPCAGTAEFRNQLVVMRYDGTDVVPLTGRRTGDNSWSFALAMRNAP
jgi:hypothetical protein